MINASCGVHDLYSSPNITRAIERRRMRWVGDVSSTGEKRREGYTVLVGKSERSCGPPRHG
jgi:hypothetical protein